MTSITSSRNLTVFKSTLSRFKWFGILYGAGLFLIVPLLIWMELGRRKTLEGMQWAKMVDEIPLHDFLFQPFQFILNIAIPIAFGLIIFYYLHQEKASTFFHSLPIKRPSLYLQKLFAGLSLIWLPVLVNGVVTYLIFSAFGVTKGYWFDVDRMGGIPGAVPATLPVGQAIVYWVLITLLMTGLFYIFTAFIGMLTGNVLVQGALSGIGLVLPLGLYMLFALNMELLVYGYPNVLEDANDKLIMLSPIVSYVEKNIGLPALFREGSGYAWYLAAAVLIAVASIFLYQKRRAEAAGDTLAAPWIRRLFKYGVATCMALTGGLYFNALSNGENGTILYLGYLTGGVLGYIIADMVAYKSFHFYHRWKGLLIFAAVFMAILFTIKIDLFGIEGKIPAQDKIKEVYISSITNNYDGRNLGKGLREPGNIQLVRELHRQIIKLKEENLGAEISFHGRPSWRETQKIIPMEITYVLNGGSKVKRNYFIETSRYRDFLKPIFDAPETKKIMYDQFFKTEAAQLSALSLHNFRTGNTITLAKRGQIEEALTALRKDVVNTSYEAAVEQSVPAMASLEFVFKGSRGEEKNFNINYYDEYKNFNAFLDKYNYLEGFFLKPEEVSSIIVRRVGTEATAEIKDKEKIKVLLEWYNRDDETMFIERQKNPENFTEKEYYGKIILKKGSPIYVMFELQPPAQQAVYGAIDKKF